MQFVAGICSKLCKNLQDALTSEHSPSIWISFEQSSSSKKTKLRSNLERFIDEVIVEQQSRWSVFTSHKKVDEWQVPIRAFSVNFPPSLLEPISAFGRMPIALLRCVTSLGVWQRIDQRALPVGLVFIMRRGVYSCIFGVDLFSNSNIWAYKKVFFVESFYAIDFIHGDWSCLPISPGSHE